MPRLNTCIRCRAGIPPTATKNPLRVEFGLVQARCLSPHAPELMGPGFRALGDCRRRLRDARGSRRAGLDGGRRAAGSRMKEQPGRQRQRDCSAMDGAVRRAGERTVAGRPWLQRPVVCKDAADQPRASGRELADDRRTGKRRDPDPSRFTRADRPEGPPSPQTSMSPATSSPFRGTNGLDSLSAACSE
jgi:hypothetical protein